VGVGVQRRRTAAVSSRAVAEGTAIWICVGSAVVAQTGAAGARDLGFRYLAGGAEPDHKTICEFLRRHGRRVNDLFTAVLEQLQAAGLGKLGVVALDSTRVQANASRERVISEAGWRAERAGKRRQVRKKSGNAAAPISNRYQKETTPKQLNIWKLLARSTAGQSCETDSEALP
jgi:hypothetical protein